MAKQLLTLSLLVLAALAVNSGGYAMCPSGGVPAVAGKLTISSGANIPLQQGNDIQCYNYTLEKEFDCPPSVSIGTNAITKV